MENKDNPLFFSAHLDDYQYSENLNAALNNTRSLGLSVPQFTVDFGFIPDLEVLYERAEDIVYLEKHDPKNLDNPPAFNCLHYAQQVWTGLQKFYNRPLLLTSGYVLGNGRKTFYEPLATLASRLEKPSDKRINLHVWVTLPDFTIVDPTLIFSLRFVGAANSQSAKDILIRNVREQHMREEHCYQPVLVGREYWDKASIKPYVFPS